MFTENQNSSFHFIPAIFRPEYLIAEMRFWCQFRFQSPLNCMILDSRLSILCHSMFTIWQCVKILHILSAVFYWTVTDFISQLVNYDDVRIFMIRNINFDSHRWPSKCSTHQRLRLFFPWMTHSLRAWPQHRNRDRLPETSRKQKYQWNLWYSMTISSVSLSISYHYWWHYISFYAHRTIRMTFCRSSF